MPIYRYHHNSIASFWSSLEGTFRDADGKICFAVERKSSSFWPDGWSLQDANGVELANIRPKTNRRFLPYPILRYSKMYELYSNNGRKLLAKVKEEYSGFFWYNTNFSIYGPGENHFKSSYIFLSQKQYMFNRLVSGLAVPVATVTQQKRGPPHTTVNIDDREDPAVVVTILSACFLVQQYKGVHLALALAVN